MFSCAFTYSFEKIRFSSLQNLDSPSKNSYIGSYYQPPERILSVSRELQFPAHSPVSADQTVSRSSQTTRNLDSKGLANFILFFLAAFCCMHMSICSLLRCCRCTENPSGENPAFGTGEKANREDLHSGLP